MADRTSAALRVPFNRPAFGPSELARVAESMRSGRTAGDGPFSGRCHEWLEEYLGAPKVLLTTSCTHALEMSALLLDIGPGDEVILPSFTFPSAANAFVLRGAHPVFVDVRPDTFNLDESKVAAAITEKTRAIVPTHYAGVACEMNGLVDLALTHEVALVEDNAHSLFGRYRGRPLGSFGVMATQSFHETKNLSCGEGGALVINDLALAESAEILREKGTNRASFFRGDVDKYEWVGVGSSYLPADLLAACLFAQLERSEDLQRRRRGIWERYQSELTDWVRTVGGTLPVVPPHCETAYHSFHVLLPDSETRNRFLGHMRERGVLAVFHYLPLHRSPMAKSIGADDVDCAVAERVSGTIARLPLFSEMSEAESAIVIEAALAFS